MPIAITKDESTGETHYALPGTFGRFTMPALAESEINELEVHMFRAAVDEFGSYIEQAPAIANDRDLSDAGRAKKLEPLQTNLLPRMAHVDAQLDRNASHFDKREQELLEVPIIEQSHEVMAIQEREIRDWWRQQSAEERSRLLKRVESESGHERFILAMLRSPIPQLDGEVQFVSSVWQRLRRLDNPGEVLAIDRGRANVEWARRGVAQVAGLTKTMLKWDNQRIARTILSSPDPAHHRGWKVFGIDAMTAESAKRAIAHEARARWS
jgi:hypothetical protein